MDLDLLREKIFGKLAEQVEADIGLPVPEPSWSQTEAHLACPHCGGLETREHTVQDPEIPQEGEAPLAAPELCLVILCVDCGAEFSPPKDSAAVVVAETLRRRNTLNTLGVHARRPSSA